MAYMPHYSVHTVQNTVTHFVTEPTLKCRSNVAKVVGFAVIDLAVSWNFRFPIYWRRAGATLASSRTSTTSCRRRILQFSRCYVIEPVCVQRETDSRRADSNKIGTEFDVYRTLANILTTLSL